jgi:hypothetical protein
MLVKLTQIVRNGLIVFIDGSKTDGCFIVETVLKAEI